MSAGAGAVEGQTPTPPPDPGADGERRVLLVGDSLMSDAHPAIEATLAAEGVDTRYVGFSGTGLLSGQGWWGPAISTEVEEWHPDVVVIEACCNYAIHEPPYRTDGGSVILPDSEEMYAEWAAKAIDAAARAGAGGAEVHWVVTPCVGRGLGDPLRSRVDRLNGIGDALGVARIDWRTALCPDQDHTSVIDVDGRLVQVRKDDGVHLTAAGNDVVARITWEAIAPSLGTDPVLGG